MAEAGVTGWRRLVLERALPRRLFLAAGSMAAALLGPGRRAIAQIRPKGRRTTMSAHDFTFPAIAGGDLPLKAWAGKPVLVVNTASFCGYTSQYRDLEAVWRRYKDRGLVVLGVPSNDFGGQEPGKAAEIKAFCETFDVSFPLADKQIVSGAGAHPFYRWVVAELGEAGAPRWNFHKYLVAPDGTLAGAWPSQVKPDAPAILREIEPLLATS
jgi:glutathione peroxidase